MSRALTCFEIFIASPDGLAEERRAFREVVEQYNEAEANPRGVHFRAVGWEDTLAGVGRPQSTINEEVRNSDYFILVLHNRWGSQPDSPSKPGYSSGSEEEYHVALECYADATRPMRKLVLLFKAVDPQQLSDPGVQLQKVLDFKKHIETEKTHYYHSFDQLDRFRELLRRHLGQWSRDSESDKSASTQAEPALGDSALERLTESRAVVQPEELHASGLRSTEKAWKLAEQGRLTDAEVEFARATAGKSDPSALISFAAFLGRLGRLSQASVTLGAAIEVAQSQQDLGALSGAYNNLGIVLRIRGDLPGAEEMHRKALGIDESLGRPEGVANASNDLGIVLMARGDPAGAEEMHRKALEIDEKLGRLEGMASAYNNLGIVLKARGDLKGAEEMHRKALEIDEKLGRLEGMASAYNNLGIVLKARGDLKGAEEMHRKALEIDQSLGRLEAMASAYNDLGIVLKARGDLAGAEEMHRKALEIDESLGRPEGVANAFGHLGIVLKTRGDLAGAEEMYRKALEIDERLGRPEGVANGYNDLGNVLKTRGDLSGAEEMYRKALEIDERLGRPEVVASGYNDLGNVLKARGDLAGADEMYRKALEMNEKLERPDEPGPHERS